MKAFKGALPRLLLPLLLLSGAATAAQDPEKTLQHGGVARTYLLHLPRGYDAAKPWPLVAALHGGGGTAKSTNTLAHMNAAADRHGFIVAYPQALYRHWNDGRQSGVADSRKVDDLGFLSALIDQIARDYNVDRKRVFATGISNGGFMSQRLACDLAGKITAIAAVAATMGRDLSAHCKPSQPVSVLIIQGTEDPLVPYEGGRVQVRGGGAIISAPDAVQKWVELNGCKAQPLVADLPDKAADGTRTRRETHSGCRQRTEVVFLRVEGGGHTWPGGVPYLPERRIGRTSRDFDATEVIWEFFASRQR